MDRKGGKRNAAAQKADKREKDEVAIFSLGEGWNNLENVVLQRP